MTPFLSSKSLTSFRLICFFISSLIPNVRPGALPPEFIHDSLIKAQIVPDAYKEPADYGIEIWFNHVQVEYGNHIWIKELDKKPTHINWIHDKKDRFTLIMTGLDAPSSDDPHEREVLYWMVGNIPETDVDAGERWAAYVPPWPLGGAGPHRVIFTIYKQYRGRMINYTHRKLGRTVKGDERKNFSTRAFAQTFALRVPWAANFFDLFDNSTYPNIDWNS